MSDSAVGKLWNRIRRQVDADAGHLHRLFFPQAEAAVMTPNDSYLRVWLSELFLAKEVAWGAERLPAVQASVRLVFGAPGPQTFVTLVQPPVTTGRGVFEDYQLTELLPYAGRSVELQAALYGILGKNNLGTAIDVLSGFASLVTPPLSTALSIADMVATGAEKIIEANASDPLLCLQGTWPRRAAGEPTSSSPAGSRSSAPPSMSCPRRNCTSATGGCAERGPAHRLRLHGAAGGGPRGTRRLADAGPRSGDQRGGLREGHGRPEEYERLRADALSRIYFSPDLTPTQRYQVAQAVKEELGSAGPGAAAAGEMTVAAIVARRGLRPATLFRHLTLSELLSA